MCLCAVVIVLPGKQPPFWEGQPGPLTKDCPSCLDGEVRKVTTLLAEHQLLPSTYCTQLYPNCTWPSGRVGEEAPLCSYGEALFSAG